VQLHGEHYHSDPHSVFPRIEAAWQDVDRSFERFCLTAEIGAIEDMLCEVQGAAAAAAREVAVSALPILPFKVDTFLADTTHMSAEQVGSGFDSVAACRRRKDLPSIEANTTRAKPYAIALPSDRGLPNPPFGATTTLSL
jgi:hypothetical protein